MRNGLKTLPRFYLIILELATRLIESENNSFHAQFALLCNTMIVQIFHAKPSSDCTNKMLILTAQRVVTNVKASAAEKNLIFRRVPLEKVVHSLHIRYQMKTNLLG